MRRVMIFLSGILLVSFSAVFAQQDKPKDTTQDSAPTAVPAEAAAKVNPVKSTPEGVASVTKLYGYHCAMCHGKEGDGKGDLAVDMKLNLHDWKDANTISKMTGGEGDRTKEEVRWNLVNLVRSFGKKAE